MLKVMQLMKVAGEFELLVGAGDTDGQADLAKAVVQHLLEVVSFG